jgi:SPP1 gp7 family putative phage head morphogenesis protein
MKNAAYWKRRAEILNEAAHKKADRSIADIEKAYREAEIRTKKEIEAWYGRLAENNQISLSDARKLLNKNELAEFKWTVEQYIQEASKANLSPEWQKKLENASAKFHISRLEAVQMGIQQQIELLYGSQYEAVDSLLREVISDGYYGTAYNVQRGLGIGWDIAKLNQNKLDKLLLKPWTTDGRTFSERIWANKASLSGGIQNELVQGVLRGDSPRKITDRVEKRFGVSRYQAGRLVHTETAYFSAAAEKESYRELDVEEVEILETLDYHTCETCGSMDGKKVPLNQMEPGVTVPPFHPNCRGTTAPVIDEELWGVGERTARDENGKYYTVPGDMTYEEWKARQNEKLGTGFVDRQRKKSYNESADRKQFARYRDLLGKNAPSSFKRFQEIKYGDDWAAFKAYAHSIKSGELTPLADFGLYKNVSEEIDEKLFGIVTSSDIAITGRSNHFIARVIGSVEQERNGVQISDIFDALISNESEVFPIKEMKNGRSQKFRNNFVEVSINPDTGNIIQANPVHSRRKVKS